MDGPEVRFKTQMLGLGIAMLTAELHCVRVIQPCDRGWQGL